MRRGAQGAIIIAITASLMAAGCKRQTVRTAPEHLRNRAGDITTRGRAEVPLVGGGSHPIEHDQLVDVRMADRVRTERRWFGLFEERHVEPGGQARLSIGELVAGCPGTDPPTSQSKEPPICMLDEIGGEPIVVGRPLRFDPDLTARIAGAGMGAGLFIYCIAECDDAGKTLGGAALLIGLLLLYTPLRHLGGGGN